MKEYFKFKSKKFAKNVWNICKKNHIHIGLIGERKSIELSFQAEQAAKEILLSAGIEEKYAHAAIHGIAPIKCDGELNGSDNWNWTTMYDGYKLQYAVKLAEKFMEGNQRCEVGMKYPHFNVKSLIKKYDLELSGKYEPKFSRDREPDQKTFNEIWQNKDKTISFSFEFERMGKGGYAGATFPTLKAAYDFVAWFVKHKSFIVKDIDLYTNGLGGLGINEIDEFNSDYILYKNQVENYIADEKRVEAEIASL